MAFKTTNHRVEIDAVVAPRDRFSNPDNRPQAK